MAAFVATSLNSMVDWFTGKTTPAAVATRYLTTYSGDPQGAGTENIATITGSANRIAITAAMAAAAAGSSSNTSILTITASAVGAATVDFIAIKDALTAGNTTGSVAVTSKSVGIGDSLTVQVGNLTISIT
jgi:hypothetical protein